MAGDMTGVLMQCTFANTPVVSPESKKPLKGASHRIKFFASHRCHRGAALLSIFELSKFLVCFQYKCE